MSVENYIAQWVAEAPVLAGSAAVVLVMIGLAFALGFRKSAELNDAELARLAAAEGARVEAAVIAPNGRHALARLSGGKLMVARVMGNDVSARVAPAGAVRVRVARGKLSAQFADLGFPPLHMRLQAPPPWLAELAGEPK
ncbi:MAG: hypothetical protein H7124_09855 [Phycisphaerales bacterium]|nr:hypothetical protein [Hyphomonadaceae bacterium]